MTSNPKVQQSGRVNRLISFSDDVSTLSLNIEEDDSFCVRTVDWRSSSEINNSEDSTLVSSLDGRTNDDVGTYCSTLECFDV